MGGVSHDEGQRLHALDEGLGVMLAQVLAQGQAVLVHQGAVQGGGAGRFGRDQGGGAGLGGRQLQVVPAHLQADRPRGEREGTIINTASTRSSLATCEGIGRGEREGTFIHVRHKGRLHR